jgi:hypothetical protein
LGLAYFSVSFSRAICGIGFEVAILAFVVAIVLAVGKWRPPWPLVQSWRLVLVLAIVVVLQATWEIPILFGAHAALPSSYTQVTWLQALSFMKLGNGITGFDLWWPSMDYFVRESAIPVISFILPLLGVVAVTRSRRRSVAVAGIGVALLSILLAGANGPVGFVAIWIFAHIPGANLFRYPALYGIALVFCLSVLIGAASDTVLRAWSSIRGARSPIQRYLARTVTVVALGGATALLIFQSYPAASGSLGHLLRPIHTPTSAQIATDSLEKLPPGQVLWVPAVPNTAIQGYVTEAGVRHPPLNAIVLGALVKGSEAGYAPLAWLTSSSTLRKALNKYHIEYVVLANESWDNFTSNTQALSEQSVVSKALHRELPHGGVAGREFSIFDAGHPGVFSQTQSGRVGALSGSNSGSVGSILKPKSGSIVLNVAPLPFLNDGANRFSLSVDPLNRASVIQFWQSYDSGWQAKVNGHILGHIVINGWANGFMVSPHAKIERIRITFRPESKMMLGLYLAFLGYGAVLFTAGIAAAMRLRTYIERLLR